LELSDPLQTFPPTEETLILALWSQFKKYPWGLKASAGLSPSNMVGC
jgi:hypothetical protein